jgi:hypothetical protein
LSLVTAFRTAQHTSIHLFCSIFESALDELALISGELRGEMVERKPFGAFNLNALLMGVASCPAAENNLNLGGLLESSHESYLGALKLKPRLLAQLSPERFFRLFALFDEATWNAPTRACAKDVIEQEHAPALVHDDRPCRHHKARLDEAHAPPPHTLRRMTPQSTEHLFQHALDNIKGKGKRLKARVKARHRRVMSLRVKTLLNPHHTAKVSKILENFQGGGYYYGLQMNATRLEFTL